MRAKRRIGFNGNAHVQAEVVDRLQGQVRMALDLVRCRLDLTERENVHEENCVAVGDSDGSCESLLLAVFHSPPYVLERCPLNLKGILVNVGQHEVHDVQVNVI